VWTAGGECTGGTCGFEDLGECQTACSAFTEDLGHDNCGPGYAHANVINTFVYANVDFETPDEIPSFAAGDYPLSVTTADFNADGHTDVATANGVSDDVSLLLGDGAGGFATAVHYAAGNWPASVTTGDFDEDGHTDLAVANALSYDTSVLLGNGSGTFSIGLSYGAGASPQSVIVGDFNEDECPTSPSVSRTPAH
jgi:hypothetical protein